ncbi:MAG: hypothetical protein ABUT39_23480 [Acidobacteriota bacterium]
MSKGDDGGQDDLTAEQLEALLASLSPDRETAGERLEAIRRRLIHFFEWRGSQRAEELTDVTIHRVARQLADGLRLRSDPYAYFCGVARLVWLEDLRREAREKKARAIHPWPPAGIGDADDEPSPLLDHLLHCLGVLPDAQRELVLRYHQGERRIQERKILCDELGIEMNALRIRVHRIRAKLLICIQERTRGRAPSRVR